MEVRHTLVAAGARFGFAKSRWPKSYAIENQKRRPMPGFQAQLKNLGHLSRVRQQAVISMLDGMFAMRAQGN